MQTALQTVLRRHIWFNGIAFWREASAAEFLSARTPGVTIAEQIDLRNATPVQASVNRPDTLLVIISDL